MVFPEYLLEESGFQQFSWWRGGGQMGLYFFSVVRVQSLLQLLLSWHQLLSLYLCTTEHIKVVCSAIIVAKSLPI